jgi:hypothetical protein
MSARTWALKKIISTRQLWTMGIEENKQYTAVKGLWELKITKGPWITTLTRHA